MIRKERLKQLKIPTAAKNIPIPAMIMFRLKAIRRSPTKVINRFDNISVFRP